MGMEEKAFFERVHGMMIISPSRPGFGGRGVLLRAPAQQIEMKVIMVPSRANSEGAKTIKTGNQNKSQTMNRLAVRAVNSTPNVPPSLFSFLLVRPCPNSYWAFSQLKICLQSGYRESETPKQGDHKRIVCVSANIREHSQAPGHSGRGQNGRLASEILSRTPLRLPIFASGEK
jgi:hypothetical protein